MVHKLTCYTWFDLWVTDAAPTLGILSIVLTLSLHSLIHHSHIVTNVTNIRLMVTNPVSNLGNEGKIKYSHS